MRRHGILILGLIISGLHVTPGWSQETETLHLSGTGSDDTVTWEFYCSEGRSSGAWSPIEVPSNWEFEGFGRYNYGRDRKKSQETGRYRHSFRVPQAWQDKQVSLVFEGVMTDTEAWINGQSVGPIHQGGFYRFSYDITEMISPGQSNLLEVLVHKVSANSSVEQAERQSDYWVFGGIYRPVYLEAAPQQHIRRCAIDARAHGQFSVDVYLSRLNATGTLVATITGPGLARPYRVVASVGPGRQKATLTTTVEGVKPWTAETPSLYTVDLSLQQEGETVHSLSQRFGFRTFEVRPGQGLFLNGQKIILKGVNRHCFWPDSGRCLNRSLSYADVHLLKEMNMNAVRMSHYPPDVHFLEACDELGLYVLDELAGWQRPSYDTQVGAKLVEEMVTRDVSHPCILFWDNANEGGWNTELDDDFARYDPQQRPVLHPWAKFSEVDTDHYESYTSTLEKLDSDMLFMPTEFLHGLYDGGHGAGLDDYWRAMLASPKGAGGFLWVFADEGAVRTDEEGRIDVDGNHAPDGILGPHREKEASFYTIKEIFSPIQIPLEHLSEAFDGDLPLENRYEFTNLKQCWFVAELLRFPLPWQQREPTRLFSQGRTGPSIRPGQRGTLALDLPDDWSSADALSLTATDPTGQEIWTWTWPIKARQHVVEALTQGQTATGSVEFERSSSEVKVTTGDLNLHFDTETGWLSKVQNQGRMISLSQGPRLINSQDSCREVTVRQSDNGVTVIAEYEGNLKKVQWDIYSNGWVKLGYRYALDGEYDLFGVQFDYPEEKMKAMRRLGDGPYRVYKNRLKGGRLSVWENKYKDHSPGVTWDFPEFRGYYANWIWTVLETTEGTITLVNASDDLYLGLYRPKDGAEPAKTKLDVPNTGLALLHGIPAIGTKFKKAAQLGPQSQKNIASGFYEGVVYLKFE